MSRIIGHVCEHDIVFGQSQLPLGGWNGPVGTCQCCGNTYGYIDSGDYSVKGSKTVMHSKRLCKYCGGTVTAVISNANEHTVETKPMLDKLSAA